MCLSVCHADISETVRPRIMKLYMRNLHLIWKISTEKNFGKIEKKISKFFPDFFRRPNLKATEGNTKEEVARMELQIKQYEAAQKTFEQRSRQENDARRLLEEQLRDSQSSERQIRAQLKDQKDQPVETLCFGSFNKC